MPRWFKKWESFLHSWTKVSCESTDTLDPTKGLRSVLPCGEEVISPPHEMRKRQGSVQGGNLYSIKVLTYLFSPRHWELNPGPPASQTSTIPFFQFLVWDSLPKLSHHSSFLHLLTIWDYNPEPPGPGKDHHLQKDRVPVCQCQEYSFYSILHENLFSVCRRPHPCSSVVSLVGWLQVQSPIQRELGNDHLLLFVTLWVSVKEAMCIYVCILCVHR